MLSFRLSEEKQNRIKITYYTIRNNARSVLFSAGAGFRKVQSYLSTAFALR